MGEGRRGEARRGKSIQPSHLGPVRKVRLPVGVGVRRERVRDGRRVAAYARVIVLVPRAADVIVTLEDRVRNARALAAQRDLSHTRATTEVRLAAWGECGANSLLVPGAPATERPLTPDPQMATWKFALASAERSVKSPPISSGKPRISSMMYASCSGVSSFCVGAKPSRGSGRPECCQRPDTSSDGRE